MGMFNPKNRKVITAIIAIILVPVSYTHLDVYKRQEWNIEVYNFL